MDAVWKEFSGNSNDLTCTAKEVTAIASSVEGPSRCERATTVKVNVTAALTFNTGRYDVGVYTYNGSPEYFSEQAALFGDKCAVSILTEPYSEPGTGSGIMDDEIPAETDVCLDVVVGQAQGGFTYDGFKFQENLEIPCLSETGDANLALQTCFTWRTSGNNDKCSYDTTGYAWPGTAAKVRGIGNRIIHFVQNGGD